MKFVKSFFLFFCIGISFYTCQNEKSYSFISSSSIQDTLKNRSKIVLKNWHFKDIKIDTLPGISLERAYDSLLSNKKTKEVVIAIIDMEIDIDHKGLQSFIWQNNAEIPNNGLDDDKNGYVDDIHGWNFLGNTKGENNRFVNYEYTRILRKYNPLFENRTIEDIKPKDSLLFIIYQRAKKKYEERTKYANEEVEYIEMVSKGKNDAEKVLANYFKNDNYTIKDLDSLKKLYPKNKYLQKMIRRKSNFIKWDYTNEYMKDYQLKTDERIKKLLNLEYNDREIQGDNPKDISDKGYGNHILNSNISLLQHGTKMAGAIVNIGFKNEIKIMPLAISAYGDEHDKDIALAIRYAVDNGAKVINMSFAKEFSLHPKWVLDAIKYADENNVLIVHAASNENENIDDQNITCFPNDHDYFNTLEVSQNFLNVGASGKILNKNLKSSFSNYGKTEVDVFAPGENIYTTEPNNKYSNHSRGTSLASAITSGVAGLIRSYYPNLTASQVKHILMDSGLEYTFKVKTPTKEDKNKMTPFNQLSKSGKVINAYNALLMAEEVSKK